MSSEIAVEGILAGWRRMDASAAAAVLRSTTWSYLTGDGPPATVAAEPMADWDPAAADDVPDSEERAARVAWNVLCHDPRFAEQLRLLWHAPFSEDFQEFIHLLVQTAAQAGAVYARHLDGDPSLSAARVARATAALMGIDSLPEPRQPEASAGVSGRARPTILAAVEQDEER